MVMFETYKDINVDEDPVIILPCKHMFTLSTLDGQLGLSDCYEMDKDGVPTKAKPFPATGSDGPIKGCPNCRSSLRSINRYNRITKKAILDESTKKFITEAHSEFQKLKDKVLEVEVKFDDEINNLNPKSALFRVEQFTKHSLTEKVKGWVKSHERMCREEEQPYGRVRGLIIDAMRKRTISEAFQVDNAAIQTTCTLRAKCLSLQLESLHLQAIYRVLRKPDLSEGAAKSLEEALSKRHSSPANASRALIQKAIGAQSATIEAEARIYWAQFAMLSVQYPHPAEQRLEPDQKEAKRIATVAEQTESLEKCLAMCKEKPGILGKYESWAQRTLAMVKGEPFYQPVSQAERAAVYAAMSVEFRGTGHWYRCQNGHPVS